MPAPQDIHIDRLQTNIAIARMNDPESFIHEKVAPTVAVDKKSDKYPVFDSADWFRDLGDKPRAPGTDPDRVDYNQSTDEFYCDNWEHEVPTPQEDFDNSDDAFEIRKAKTSFLTNLMDVRLDRLIVSTAFTTGVWTTDVTGGADFTKWSDHNNSDPTRDIDVGGQAILKATGQPQRNLSLWLGVEVWDWLKRHPDLLNLLGSNAPKKLTREQAAELLEIREIIIGESVYESAKEGATSSKAFITGKNALMFFRNGELKSGGSVQQLKGLPTAMVSFAWSKGNTRTGGQTVGIRRYRETRPDVEVQGIMTYRDFKITCADAGYFFSGAVD